MLSMVSHHLFSTSEYIFGDTLVYAILLSLPYLTTPLSCRTSGFPKGVIVLGSCEFQVSATCQVGCVSGGRVVWKDIVKCLSDGRWSPMAPCDENYPPGDVQPVPCVKLDGTPSNSPAVCARISFRFPQDTLCPTLGNLQVDLAGCSRRSGTECSVACKERRKKRFTIRCLPSGKWSNIPDCAGGERACPDLSASKVLMPRCSGSVGERCEVSCASGYALTGLAETTCSSSGQWSPLPVCEVACPKPSLSPGLSIVGRCPLVTGKTCSVRCRKGLWIQGGVRVINCQNGTWSKIPKCVPGKCPKPKLSSGLSIAGRCSRTNGQTCKVRCRKGLWLQGKTKVIKCQNRKWSKIPKCGPGKCPKPKLSPGLSIVGRCSRTNGKSCRIRCRKGLFIQGKTKVIKCQKSKWSKIPKCGPGKCPKPKLTPGLSIKGKCSHLNGQTCRIRCRKGLFIQGKAKVIKCQKSKWSKIPKCGSGKQCPKPKLSPGLTIMGKCQHKNGQTCKVRCRKGLWIEGNRVIKCQKSKWSKIPKCGSKSQCPKPKLSPGLSIMGKCPHTNGKTCRVRCRKGMFIQGKTRVIKCQKSKWSKIPKCGSGKQCPKLKLRKDLKLVGNCPTRLNSKCRVQCKMGALKGGNKLTCLQSGKWSKPPQCEVGGKCPVPIFSVPSKVEAAEDCSNKSPGQICKLKCKTADQIPEKMTIKCQNNSRWDTFPVCKKA